MKKILHIAVTVVTMLVVSRFIVRIIDATVQIDDDIGLVLRLMAAADAVIGLISARLYRHLSV